MFLKQTTLEIPAPRFMTIAKPSTQKEKIKAIMEICLIFELPVPKEFVDAWNSIADER